MINYIIILITYLLFAMSNSNKGYLQTNRSKVRRAREKYREALRQQEKASFDIINGIYVDGRKDTCLTIVERYEKSFRRTDIEEHYVIVGEPGQKTAY